MSRFKEYNNTTFYIGPEGTGVTSTGEEIYTVLYTGYATYPFDTNNSELVWFGLKQGDNFEGVLSQNIDYSNGFNFTSSHSDCWAKIGPQNPAWTPDNKTGMEPYFFIGKSDVYREITFKWKDFVVFKFIQYDHGQPNKLLICKPTWDIDPYTITGYAIIGFSTSATSIRSIAFDAGQGGTYLKKSLCAIEQLNNPNTIQWMQKTIQQLDTLKYIRGINYKTNGMSDYTLIKVIVDTGEEIIEDDFDRIKELGIIYIYVRKNINGDYVRVGRITMAEQGEYMFGEIA